VAYGMESQMKKGASNNMYDVGTPDAIQVGYNP
jgi:hypothetical protein